MAVLYAVIIGFGLIFLPIPNIISEDIICKPCAAVSTSCPRCPKKGEIVWTASNWQRILARLQSKSGAVRQNGELQQPSPLPNWQRFTHPTLGYTFDYPADFEIKEVGDRVMVLNGFRIITTTLEPREVTVNNFELTIEPIQASWDEIVDQLSYEGDLTFGSHTFREVYTGAEGDGIRAYFVQIENRRWLEFAKREYFEGAISEEFMSDQRYLDTTEQNDLVKQILSTVTLTDPNKP